MQSASYLQAGLHAVDRNWYRKYRLEEIHTVLQETQEINRNTFTGPELKYKRRWDPKPGSSERRPINVPRLSHRIHMRMLSDILNVWFEQYNSPSQHGFRPFRGVITAWDSIIPKLSSSPNIYEYDFRKFFDSINLTWLEQQLIKQGMPSAISNNLITSLLTQPPKLKKTCGNILHWQDEQEQLITYHYYKTGQYKKTLDWEQSKLN